MTAPTRRRLLRRLLAPLSWAGPAAASITRAQVDHRMPLTQLDHSQRAAGLLPLFQLVHPIHRVSRTARWIETVSNGPASCTTRAADPSVAPPSRENAFHNRWRVWDAWIPLDDMQRVQGSIYPAR